MVIKLLISRIKEKQNKKRQEKDLKEEEEKARNMYSYRETIFRIKRENGELETSLREEDFFFSAGEKRAEKSVCSPQANWKRTVINFVPAKRSSRGSYIKTRNLIPCYACVAHLLLGCLWPKKMSLWSLCRRKTKCRWTDLPESIAWRIPPSSGPIFERRGDGLFLDKVTQTDQYRQLKASCLHLPWVWCNIAFFDEVCEWERNERATPLRWRSIIHRGFFFIRALDSLYRENRGSREVLADHNFTNSWQAVWEIIGKAVYETWQKLDSSSIEQ